MPVPILDSAVVSVGGNLYTFAGVANGAIVATSYKFDGSVWTAIAPYPAALEFPTAATDGTNIFIVGGSDGSGVSQTLTYRYNVASNTYTQLASFSTATWNQKVVYLNGKLYKFCGSNNTVSTNALEIYDIAANTWSVGAPYPITESFVGGWAQGNYVYGAGGIDGASSVPTAKTYRYDTASNTWDDASIADLPDTRWGAASGLYTDGLLAGGYVAGAATANISTSVISWDQPSNTWQNVPNMIGERARMGGAVLNGSFYVVGGRSVASPAFNGENSNQKLLCLNVPTNIIAGAGRSIDSAGANGVLDPGETVTVSFGAQNIGGPGVVCTTAALTGTLQASGGVISPSGPQTYGMLCSGNAAVFRSFTFTVDSSLACGSTVTASIQFTDGATNYGTATYTFVTGSVATASSENFDGVVAPALPAGWTSSATGVGVPWVTTTTTPSSPPNSAFAPDPSNIGDSVLMSNVIAVPAGGARVSFKNNYATESTFDGMVLEISIAGGAYADIISAGGSFVSGGYNATISSSFGSPIAGRMAWSGSSGGYIDSVVNLPAAANGQDVQLKWRMASDNSVAATGVNIDDVRVSNPVCGGTAPAVSSAISRKTHGAAGTFDVNLPLVPLSGAIGVECRTGAVSGDHQIIVTFAAPVSLGSAVVTAGTGSVASASTLGSAVIVNLTGVSDVQRLSLQLSNVSAGGNLGSVTIPMGLLLGDTSGNRAVSGTDVSQTKAAASTGGMVTAGTFRTDVNTNGVVNGTDVSVVKAKSGGNLP
ncbi:MAG: dockerin type I domain-containing protein [Chthoniobacterales bacterium]